MCLWVMAIVIFMLLQEILSLRCSMCLASRSISECFIAIILIIMAIFFGTALGSHQAHLAISATLPSLTLSSPSKKVQTI